MAPSGDSQFYFYQYFLFSKNSLHYILAYDIDTVLAATTTLESIFVLRKN